MDDYEKLLEDEIMQFMFLASNRDRHMLIGDYKKENIPEYVRLASIAMVFGYRRLFLKITATAEADFKDFMGGFDILNGNFNLLDNWINEFIERIKVDEVRKISREFWEEKKTTIDKDNFTLRQML